MTGTREVEWWKNLPTACQNCKLVTSGDFDYNDYTSWYHCYLGIFLPVKKQTCKRQKVEWRL